jgi:NADH-quinone oxidoreductase subunit D
MVREAVVARQEIMTINMGPHHPSTHGVLRLILELDGEVVESVVPDIGYLHRGVEKLSENRKYLQVLPLTDRLDYLGSGTTNLSYILAVEKLLGIEVPDRARYIRTIIAELTRINSHLLWIGSSAGDCGAVTVLLYALRERESVLDLFEETTGQRMMLSYVRPGGVMKDLLPGFQERLGAFLDDFAVKVNEYERLLTKNRIWLKRTKGIGVISREDAISLGLSGPTARGSGVDWDIRRDEPYEAYDEVDFKVPVQTEGDVYARYLVRIEEMRQSIHILRQLIEKIPDGPFIDRAAKYMYPDKEKLGNSMEAMIHHFKLVVEGLAPPAGEAYSSIEGPKGEIGFYIVSDGSPQPYRLRIRPPCFVNLQSIMTMVKGNMLADVVAVIGSLDIVLGEIDR